MPLWMLLKHLWYCVGINLVSFTRKFIFNMSSNLYIVSVLHIRPNRITWTSGWLKGTTQWYYIWDLFREREQRAHCIHCSKLCSKIWNLKYQIRYFKFLFKRGQKTTKKFFGIPENTIYIYINFFALFLAEFRARLQREWEF